MKTNFQKKLKSLSEGELESLAHSVESKPNYLTSHIYYARRVPKPQMMRSLQAALKISDADMFRHFYRPTT